ATAGPCCTPAGTSSAASSQRRPAIISWVSRRGDADCTAARRRSGRARMSEASAAAGGVPWWLWIVLTLGAAAAQTARNATQKSLTVTLGTVGATLVRFFFGLPFAALSLWVVLGFTGLPAPPVTPAFFAWLA